MSRFLSRLELELMLDAQGKELKNRDGRQLWVLLSDFSYQSDIAKQTITAPAGFVTDLASVPNAALAIMGECAQMASIPHDYLYSTGKLPRLLADQVLKEAMIVSGEPAWKAAMFYAAVRVGGSGHYGGK